MGAAGRRAAADGAIVREEPAAEGVLKGSGFFAGAWGERYVYEVMREPVYREKDHREVDVLPPGRP